MAYGLLNGHVIDNFTSLRDTEMSNSWPHWLRA